MFSEWIKILLQNFHLNALRSPYKIPRALLENMYPQVLNFVPIYKIQ